jgi:hypothetical protein
LLLDGRAGFLNAADRADEIVLALQPPLGHGFLGIYLALPINWSSELAFIVLTTDGTDSRA